VRCHDLRSESHPGNAGHDGGTVEGGRSPDVPLFDAAGKPALSGTMGCLTCHDPHAGSTRTTSRRRMPTFGMRVRCSWRKFALPATRGYGGEGPEIPRPAESATIKEYFLRTFQHVFRYDDGHGMDGLRQQRDDDPLKNPGRGSGGSRCTSPPASSSRRCSSPLPDMGWWTAGSSTDERQLREEVVKLRQENAILKQTVEICAAIPRSSSRKPGGSVSSRRGRT